MPPAPAPAARADLGLTTHDIGWNAQTDQIEATIHNLGSADAHNIQVAFYRGKELLERAVITRIGAPLDLQRETITVGTWRHRDTMTEGDVVTVVVDPDGKIPEITRVNNRASWRLALNDADRERIETRRLTMFDRRANLGASPIRQVRTLTNVVYGDDDPEMQRLDAYLVSSEKPTPVIIEFHGGGWRTGEKSDARSIRRLAPHAHARRLLGHFGELPADAEGDLAGAVRRRAAGARVCPEQGRGMESRPGARRPDRRLGRRAPGALRWDCRRKPVSAPSSTCGGPATSR